MVKSSLPENFFDAHLSSLTESLAVVLAGVIFLAQVKYLIRHRKRRDNTSKKPYARNKIKFLHLRVGYMFSCLSGLGFYSGVLSSSGLGAFLPILYCVLGIIIGEQYDYWKRF